MSAARERARDFVADRMKKMLPTNAPQCFARITSARFVGRSPRRAVADLELFDGLPGRVEVTEHNMGGVPGWKLYWDVLDGGDIELAPDNLWQRVAR